jgi:hypothetical protein
VTPRVLVIGAVVLAAVALAGAAFRLIDRQPAAADRTALAPVPAHTPAGSQPGQGATPTPFAAAPTATPTPTPTPSPTPRATPTPTPITVVIQDTTLQGRRGRGFVTLSATTAPRTTCTIAVGYSPPPQLQPAVSSGSGAVSWRWTVSTEVQPGIYQIQVTCGTGAAGATISVS